jgi:condensin complex subunit 2
MPVPFESQFFNDPDDDGGDYAFVDDALDETPAPDHEEHDDLWQGTQGQQLKRARPENVNFAKKAKRVDVKRLKDDIWSGLRGLVPDEGEGEVGGADKDGGNDTVSEMTRFRRTGPYKSERSEAMVRRGVLWVISMGNLLCASSLGRRTHVSPHVNMSTFRTQAREASPRAVSRSSPS